MIHWCEW